MKKAFYILLIMSVLFTSMPTAFAALIETDTVTQAKAWTNDGSVAQTIPPAYAFTHVNANGKTYTYSLLNKDEDGHYFILCNDRYGKVTLNPAPTDNVFDPETPGSIACWLNADFLDGTALYGTVADNAGYTIDSAIRDYIVEHDWYTEANFQNGSVAKHDFIANCKVSLLSWTEYTGAYSSKIGYRSVQFSGSSQSQVVFRSPAYNTISSHVWFNEVTGNIASTNVVDKNFSGMHIRPCFYVTKEYFQNVKLGNIGSEVANLLKTEFSTDELSGVYTPQELLQIGYSAEKTELDKVSLTGIRAAGQLLNVEYDIKKQAPDTAIDYAWFYAPEKDGAYEKIDCAQRGYVIEDEYEGQYIKATVKVYNGVTGEKFGAYSLTTDRIAAAKDIAVVPSSLEQTPTGKKAVFTVANNTGGEKTVYLMLAAYDADNAMVGFCGATTAVAGGTDEYFVELDGTNAAFYRLMAWDSKDAAQPLCGITVQ